MTEKKEKPKSDAPTRRAGTEGPVAPERRADRPPRRRRARSRRLEGHATPSPTSDTFEPTVDERGGAPDSDADVAARIRQLEEKLDQMIESRARARGAAERRSPAPGSLVERRSTPPALPEPEGVLGTARELLSTGFYLRRWGRLGLRHRSEEVDEFGYDPVYEHRLLPFFDFLYRKYFRVETHGVERVPNEGRCLIVANHSGTIPVDGMMLRLGVRREHPRHREVRWLAEDAIFHFPFLGVVTNRIGAVRACQENAGRLLDR